MPQAKGRAVQFLTSSEAARILGLTPASVRAIERAGKLPALKTVTGVRLFELEEVERLAEARRERRVDPHQVAV
jgi:DNA-binding transcriptional MerR regulator